MKPMVVTTRIDAPPERVFEIATDIHHAAERVTGIDSIEVLTEGPFAVGFRWRETRTISGRRESEELEVTELEPGRSYTAEAHSHGCRYRSVVRCEPADQGTDLSITFGGEPTSFGSRVAMTLMTPLLASMTKEVRRCLEEDLADLKRHAEAAA